MCLAKFQAGLGKVDLGGCPSHRRSTKLRSARELPDRWGRNQEACRPKSLTLFTPHTDLGNGAGARVEDAKNKFRWQCVCCVLKISPNSQSFLPAGREAAVGSRSIFGFGR